jgi:Zn-dependent protease
MYFESSGQRLFSVAGIDVSISFWYVVIMGFILIQNLTIGGFLFASAITLSILIHEFGHAVPSKLYGLHPSILLHGFGGLCSHQPADSDWKDILIIVAGPLVEIAFGLAAFAVLGSFQTPGVTLNWELFLYYFAYFSVVWGAINLFLPLYPLDGGQLLHMILRRFMVEHKAQDIALKTSIVVAIPCGIYCLVTQMWIGIFLVAFILMGNFSTLNSGASLVGRQAKVRASPFVKDNLAAAEAAFADEDWREAARLCHLMRSSNNPIAPKQMKRVWEILALSTVEQGEYEEAEGWLRQAPDTAAVQKARETVDRELTS